MDPRLDALFINQLRDGKCVLFVGAGLSAAAGYKTWEELLREIEAHARAELYDLNEEGLKELCYIPGALSGTTFPSGKCSLAADISVGKLWSEVNL